MKNNYLINSKHPLYGTVKAMGIKEGEPYRMLLKNGTISLIPLDVLEIED
jgi:hypothetical protein